MPKPDRFELVVNGTSFTFELCHRQLTFGDAGDGEYYWIDGRTLRHRSRVENLRACIDHWWAQCEAAGESDEVDNQINLVLAEAYPLVNTSRAMQNVFLDAHLHETAGRDSRFDVVAQDAPRLHRERTFELPPEERSRLVELVRSRDSRQIQGELERLFHGDAPSDQERSAFTEAARRWIENGITALRKGGRDGLRRYILGDLQRQIASYRKGHVSKLVRLFLNRFAYECKVAFYTCYATAWAFLLPQLQHAGLSELSIRFMQLWHNQNQPQATADGLVLSMFSGQVLALHPLSAFIMNDPAHLNAIGRWVNHPEYARLHAENQVGECDEYWNVVLTILLAAHEYRRSHDRWEASRGQSTTHSAGSLDSFEHPNSMSWGAELEEYLADKAIFCEVCSGILQVLSYSASGEVEPTVLIVRCRCRSCQRELFVQFDPNNA